MKYIPFLLLSTSLCGATYLSLDNRTAATSDEIFNDPFLALRTKTTSRDNRYCVETAWENLENFQCPEWEAKAAAPQEEFLSTSLFTPLITNESPLFDHTSPSFTVETKALHPQKIYWQISDSRDFEQIAPNLEEIQPFSTQITLSTLDQTFLNPDDIYYFRAKVLDETGWTKWSAAFAFQPLKPMQPQEIACTFIEPGKYVLSWMGNASSYLIFGDDESAFIPSIYDTQSTNLVAETTDCSLTVDGSHAYYRIVAAQGQSYSIPSELVVAESFSSLLEELTPSFGTPVTGYRYNPHVPRETWNSLKPYFLPTNHPAKALLDKVFQTKTRVLQDLETLKSAGFRHPKPRQWTRLIVTSHKKIPGYIVKLYTDHQRPHRKLPEWYFWKLRIEGVTLIRNYIEQHGQQAIFKTPGKWIYPVPHHSSPMNPQFRKNFILVEEDMDILDDPANEEKWKRPSLKIEKLDQLFALLQTLGLWDCAKPANIPFGKDGRIAFIDTQTYHTWPVKHSRLTPFLAPVQQAHWEALIQSTK